MPRLATVEIRIVSIDHPDAQKLIAAVQQEYVNRYGGEDATPVEAAEFVAPLGVFYLGYRDGEPVACGGWRLRDPATAEIKRMYVVPAARGRGHARALLTELERSAAAHCCRHIVLETGTAQPEAIGLYTSSGYSPVVPFGYYRRASASRHYGKALRRCALC